MTMEIVSVPKEGTKDQFKVIVNTINKIHKHLIEKKEKEKPDVYSSKWTAI